MTKGFKVFNEDWTCNGFQYEVGKTFEMEDSPICCNRGFHFCTKLSDCFNYYPFNSDNKVAEVEAIGEVVSDSGDTKHCTNKIKIVRELTWHEVLDLVNMGKDCTGYCNSGNRNSGDWNSGNRNSGDWNSGDCNSGNWNSGNRNSGNRNSGNRNSGDWNSGNRNSGDWNSGDCNSGNWNSGNRNSGNWNSGDCNSGDWNDTSFSNGVFNTKEPNIYMFDELTEMTYRDWLNHPARFILNGVPFDEIRWVYSENMTDDEKKEHPEHDVTGGFLKEFDYSKNRQNWWNGLDKDTKEKIKSLPNFDKQKFERITGIKVD
ncbi:hypothetical protein C5Q96_05260 [Mogibacterium diversum]|uniref:DUF7666 domain-containing protein n=1 Tax=Mogibacterium diversum TaxID=114527 RepID=A0A2S0L4Z9_9FIRM|nr:hypothetical protein [Mogibacterium diversum]AVM48284.1 hypothetical protein C5Q96_05260 [Mogibacterium diversum]